MDYSKSNMLSIDLNKIYEVELHALVRENEDLRVQNETLKLQLRTEKKENKVLQDELQELKKNHKKSDASETLTLCSGSTLCRGLDLLKKKHTVEMEKLSTELFRAKQALKEFTNKLHKEKTQRIQTEADKLEAIEIAEELFKITEELQKAFEGHSAQRTVLLPTVRVDGVKPAPAVFNTQDMSALQKKTKQEQLPGNTAETETLQNFISLETNCEKLEELRDASEAEPQNLSTERMALTTERDLHCQIIELQQQLQREEELKAETIHIGKILLQNLEKTQTSRKLRFHYRHN